MAHVCFQHGVVRVRLGRHELGSGDQEEVPVRGVIRESLSNQPVIPKVLV